MMNLFENLQMIKENYNDLDMYTLKKYLKSKYNCLKDITIGVENRNSYVNIFDKIHPRYYRMKQFQFIDDTHELHDNLSQEEITSTLENIMDLYVEKRNEYFNSLQQLPKININIDEDIYHTYGYEYVLGEFTIRIKSKTNSTPYGVRILNVYHEDKIKISELKDCQLANIEKVKNVIKLLNDKGSFNNIHDVSDFLKSINCEFYELY